MDESTLIDAKETILSALRRADKILPAGQGSLLAIASRALEPKARLSPGAIARILGLHPSVVIAITIVADLARDTESRRELGLALFERLKLSTPSPELSNHGRLLMALWCLEHLRPMEQVLDKNLLGQALELAHSSVNRRAAPGSARGGEPPLECGPSAQDMRRIQQLQSRAMELQRSELGGVKAGKKERLGISDEQRFQRHAAQAIRALLQGLVDQGSTDHIAITVAGEVTRALEAGLGFAAAAGFTLDLAHYLEQELRCLIPERPAEHLARPPEN